MKISFRLLLAVFTLFSFTGCETAQQVLSGMNTGGGALSTTEIAAGLKEALSIGTQNSNARLSSLDGFFGNAAIKILMPEEAQKVESSLRSIGLGSLVDKAILSMNRAAEDAAKSATPVFVNAIKQMTITDAVGILKGGDYAATDYFKTKTTEPLTNAFRPVIEKALTKTDATKYWNDVFSAYNKFAAKPINTDLAGYVTEKSLAGIFHEVGQEEQKIRKDPAARVTELLKKVFGS
ncbi:MAG: DUF4197 domain-containing protein [Chitinophagaceae bacterium]|nr:DUF4197 domain-containing protein [Chitinophagaceae bacterium]